jgi:hypothetical protein
MPYRSFFAAPVFPGDEARSIRARLLNAILLGNAALMGVCSLATLGQRGLPKYLPGLMMGFALTGLGLRWCVARGWDRAAGAALLVLGFVATTVAVASFGTIRVPITGFYLAFVIGAGLLFRLPGLLLFIGLGSGAIGGLIIAENSGWLPPPNYAVTLTQWIVSTAILATIGGWTFGAMSAISRALERAESELVERRRTETLLRERNDELTRALGDVKILRGMLPICSGCKKNPGRPELLAPGGKLPCGTNRGELHAWYLPRLRETLFSECLARAASLSGRRIAR